MSELYLLKVILKKKHTLNQEINYWTIELKEQRKLTTACLHLRF